MFDLRSVVRDIFDKFNIVDIRLNKLETYESGFAPAFGNLYVKDGAVAQVVTTTPAKMTGFTTAGLYRNTTVTTSDDSIIIITDGTYQCEFTCSFSGAVGTDFQLFIRVDAVESNYGIHRKLNAAGDVGAVACQGPLELVAGNIVTVYVESDNAGGANFVPNQASLTLIRIN